MKTILAVDDSSTMRSSIKFTLSKAGYNVYLAEDGQIALDQLNTIEEKIDLFVFDVNMPNMDGITLIKRVREIDNFKFTPIIFLTTDSQVSKQKEARDAGATGWVMKPFKAEEFIKVINRFA